jgi:thiamine-monophosphate kinase
MPKKNEFEIISSLFAPMAGEGSFEFKDDAAELKVPEGFCLVVTQDAIAEGVHFSQQTLLT